MIGTPVGNNHIFTLYRPNERIMAVHPVLSNVNTRKHLLQPQLKPTSAKPKITSFFLTFASGLEGY